MAALRAGEDLTRTWLCVDMDAFFAACEELDNPALVHLRLDLGFNILFFIIIRHSQEWSPGMHMKGVDFVGI